MKPFELRRFMRVLGRGTVRALVGFVRVIPRIYATVLIGLIGYLTYQSVAYLIGSLFAPTIVPEQITGFPARLDESFLRSTRASFKALDWTEHPRTPPAHYHRIDSWLEPDNFNTCARGGCHAPLPHSRRKEVRAFLNMHATSIHCGVCHMKTEDRPLRLAWYDLKTGQARERPAILDAYDLVTSAGHGASPPAPDEDFQDRLVGLLRTAATAADELPALKLLADHVAAIRVENPAFATLIESVRNSLPRHFRGEYGAKLAMVGADGRPILAHPNTGPLVEQYLRSGSTMSEADRAQLLEKIHPLRRSEALRCSDCHRPSGGLLDFAAAGYPEARVQALMAPVVTQMIEHIDEGRTFHFPGFIAPEANGGTEP